MTNIRNPNDVMTDEVALGPSQMGRPLPSKTTYVAQGKPNPPGGWNKTLGTDAIGPK